MIQLIHIIYMPPNVGKIVQTIIIMVLISYVIIALMDVKNVTEMVALHVKKDTFYKELFVLKHVYLDILVMYKLVLAIYVLKLAHNVLI